VLEQTLDELSAYPLLMVPNWVPFTPPAPERPRLRQIAEKHHVRVTSSIIREYR
jgi:chromosome partitioning protein